MRRFALFACFLLLVVAVFAQVGTTITGTITDPTGAVVPNASLSVKSEDTGAVYAGGTTGTGNYVISLPTGNYELTVKVMGFKTTTVKNIHIETGATFKQDVKLELGAQAQETTVTGQADLLKAESADITHNVAMSDADNLPVLTIGTGTGLRNPMQVVNLLPGASFSTGAFNAQYIRINGLPANSQAIKIDGQDASNGLWREQTNVTQSGVDAIQEIAIQTSNFAAEFGQAGGGIFNLTMKSGTNQYHGSAYDYYVNEALNAGTPGTDGGTTNSANCYAAFQTSTGAFQCYSGIHTKNKVRQTDYGFTVGGPIDIPKVYNGHDKTFFFFNFEQYRQNTSTPSGLTTVPTTAYQTGDFSAALLPQLKVGSVLAGDQLGCAPGSPASCGRPVFGNEIYDPYSTFQDPVSGTTQRNPFTGNKIPLSMMCPGCNGTTTGNLYGDSVALKTQALFPQPNTGVPGALINNYAIPAYTNFNHNTNPSLKLDHSISPTVKLSAYWSNVQQNSPNNNGFLFSQFPFTTVEPTATTSNTYRLNYDQTITPTLLLHLGIGYIRTVQPVLPPTYQAGCLSGTPISSSCPGIGLNGFYANEFPTFGGLTTGTQGGSSLGIGGGGFTNAINHDNKPTANASLTWVKNNHTYKLGGDLYIENIPVVGRADQAGDFNFSNAETSNPALGGIGFAGGLNAGFNYASFLLGQPDNYLVAPFSEASLGNHGIGMYIQDTWKVTRKLTLDYGLRYDYQTLLHEQYGRMQDFSAVTPNENAGGRLGGVIYEGYGPGNSTGNRCQCTFQSNYPYAVGPRLGVAYQINPKTVFRAGVGVSYGTTATNAYLSYNAADFYTINASGYGVGPYQGTGGLQAGNPYRANNPYGFAPFTYPNFDPGKYPIKSLCGNSICFPPGSPFISIDRNAGRPGRIFSYNIGLQREVTRNLVVEASWVGNRGAWFTGAALDNMDVNAQPLSSLMAQTGLNLLGPGAAANLALLNNTTIGSPTAIAAGPQFSTPAYPGFPTNQFVKQLCRPFPQYAGYIPPFLGPPLGDTYYDSLQAKVTKRYSHGLDLQSSFTWQKELTNGTNGDSSYVSTQIPIVVDPFNYAADKQISVLSHPFLLVVSGTYTTPKIKGDGGAVHILSLMARDWQIGAVLRYTSGTLLAAPPSNSTFLASINYASPLTAGNPLFVPNGQPFFLNSATGAAVDPNCRCFDPTRALVLNPAAWTDAPAGSYGFAAPYYNNFRWQRQPSEAMSLARNFRMGKEGKQNLQIRMEFQNVFNRLFWGAPADGAGFFGNNNPASLTTCAIGFGPTCAATSSLTGGFGFVNTINGAGAQPRTGQLVARFTF